MLNRLKEKALENIKLSRAELLEVAAAPLTELIDAAAGITAYCASRRFNLCAIINAKSGRCSENCRWCAQSRHYPTHAATYPLLPLQTVLQSALNAQAHGISRFSIVTSGRKLSPREVREVADLVRELKGRTGLEICISAGLLTEKEFSLLAQAGVARCHCNLEASERFFPQVCSSHSTQDKIRSLQAAKRAGLELCSGGIIGMGETREDRIDLAMTLRELDIPSIPINILEPIAGTPLADTPPLPEEEILRTIAVFRFANPKAFLRFAGGRRRLSESTTRLALRAGINSAIAGDMLTTEGADPIRERGWIKDGGYQLD